MRTERRGPERVQVNSGVEQGLNVHPVEPVHNWHMQPVSH